MRKGTGGFTLIELMVVVAIVALLSAVAYPAYSDHVRKARRVEAQLALVDTMQKQEQYRAQHHTYVAFSADAQDPDAGQFRWWVGREAASSAYEIDGYACAGQTIAQCVELRARPGTERVKAGHADPECGALTYDSVGRQTSSGTSDKCWP